MSELTTRATKLAPKSQVMQAAFEAEAAEVAAAVLDRARRGDAACMRLVVERLAPAVRERNVTIKAPVITSLSDLPPAVAQVLAQVAAGELTPSEGEKVAGLLGAWRESVEVVELQRRIAALEERANGKV